MKNVLIIIILLITSCGEEEISEEGICRKHPKICKIKHFDTFCVSEREQFIMDRYKYEIETEVPKSQIMSMLTSTTEYKQCLEKKFFIRHISERNRESDRVRTSQLLLKHEAKLIESCKDKIETNVYCSFIIYNKTEKQKAKKYFLKYMDQELVIENAMLIEYVKARINDDYKSLLKKIQALIDKQEKMEDKIMLLKMICKIYREKLGVRSKEYMLHVMLLNKLVAETGETILTEQINNPELIKELDKTLKQLLSNQYKESIYYEK